MTNTFLQRLIAEFTGTAFLLIGVVGSGIMAEALSGGNDGIALLANAIATGAMLYMLITILGPISGAHFNPVVTLAFTLRGAHAPREAAGFILVQIAGGIVGVWLSHVMFDLDVFQLSTKPRSGLAQWSSEIIATFGLLFTIFGGLKSRPDAVPTLVALYITGAYWFTSSTSFANPAVTIARSFTNTFAGINLAHMPMFILAQLIGGALMVAFAKVLFKD
jgi:glycerol uptake facilitator-like aquaporin